MSSIAETANKSQTKTKKAEASELKGKEVLVTLELLDDTISKLDDDGAVLVWSENPEEFRELSEDVIAKLGLVNKTRYGVFREIVERRVKESASEDEDFLDLVTVADNAGTATQQLDPGKKAGFIHYWARPDMVAAMRRKGYRVAKEGWSTLHKRRDDGTYRIQDRGETELLLMEITPERKQIAKSRRKSRRDELFRKADDQARENVERLGVKTVDKNHGGDYNSIGEPLEG